jgi:phenylpyruvate tautomerase PptA (4-oxalocrotonate tautomerase family)
VPLVNVFSSAEPLDARARDALLLDLSQALSGYFQKPETWVMTCLSPRTAMTFGGTLAPACYVEIKNVGTLTPDASEKISADLCARLETGLGVPKERIYVEFTNAVGHLWGWNGETFG